MCPFQLPTQVARKYCANIGSIIIYWLIIGILDSNIRLISNQYQDKIYFFIISTWYWVNIQNVLKILWSNSASLVYLRNNYCWKLCYERESQSNIEFKKFINEYQPKIGVICERNNNTFQMYMSNRHYIIAL